MKISVKQADYKSLKCNFVIWQIQCCVFTSGQTLYPCCQSSLLVGWVGCQQIRCLVLCAAVIDCPDFYSHNSIHHQSRCSQLSSSCINYSHCQSVVFVPCLLDVENVKKVVIEVGAVATKVMFLDNETISTIDVVIT